MLTRIPIFVLLFSLTSAATAQSSQSGYGQKSTGSQASPRPGPQTVCPWFTEGSAAKVLGGGVSVTASVPNTGEGSCKFVRQQGPPNSLQILISKTNLPPCPAGSVKLTGIGNEAAECRLPASHGEVSKMVSSRVRELHFSVTLTDHGQKTPAKSMDEEDDVLAQIAEQVAGNLY
jgi:hypothetical protein